MTKYDENFRNADLLGEMNQVVDMSEWENGEEEKNREQLEEMFGPQ